MGPVRRLAATMAIGGLLVGGCTAQAPVPNAPPTAIATPAGLSDALSAITNDPRYKQATWGYVVLDQASGATVLGQNAEMMFDPGSTMKTYSVSTALSAYGTDYAFHTPVYRQGIVANGALTGNVVLVGSGDLSFGLRQQPDGTLYYENTPALDHSYANIGIPGAVEPPGNPLAALDQLAQAVRTSGITHVEGNVVIDDRLFTTYHGFPDGLISPIWVNENLIDVMVTPSATGQPASINWRPMTASYTVESQVTTVANAQPGSLQVAEPTPGHLVVSGTIAPGAAPTLVVHEVADPASFARTAFIEALQRAGVTVTAAPTGANPANLLPPRGSYQPGDKVGEHVSATLAQYANLILKVSYNRGADLMTCLAAVKAGSTDCEQGLVAETKTITGLGVPVTSVYPMDGAGSDDQGRTTPLALAQFLKAAAGTPYGKALAEGLPVLGQSGTLANVLSDSPVAGHAQIKTGNRAVGTVAGNIILLGNSLAGYVQAKSGRQITLMIAVGNVPIATPEDVQTITTDQARMVEAIQQGL